MLNSNYAMELAEYILDQDCELEDFSDYPSKHHAVFKALAIKYGIDHAMDELNTAITNYKNRGNN
jgi:hypothetical protein